MNIQTDLSTKLVSFERVKGGSRYSLWWISVLYAFLSTLYFGEKKPRILGQWSIFSFLSKLSISNTKNYFVLKVECVIKAFTTRFFSQVEDENI